MAALARDPQVMVAASRFLVPVLAIAAGIMLSQELGPAGRGHVATAVLDVEVASVIVGLGLPVAGRSLVARGRWSAPAVLTLSRLWNRWLMVPTFAVALGLFWLSDAGRSGDAVVISVVFMAAAALATDRLVVEGVTSATSSYGFHAAVSALLNVTPVVTIFIVFVSGHLTIATGLAAYLLGHLAAWVLSERMAARIGKEDEDDPELSAELQVAWRGSAAPHLLEFLNKRLDLLLLSVLATTDEVGLFAVAASAARLPATVGQVAVITVSSRLQTWRQDGAAGLRRYLIGYGVAVLAVSLMTGVAGVVLIPVVYGSAFTESATLLVILLVGTCLVSVATPATIILLADGRTTEAGFANLIGTIATGIGVVVGFSLGGLRWAATGSTLGFAVTAVALFLALRRRPVHSPTARSS